MFSRSITGRPACAFGINLFQAKTRTSFIFCRSFSDKQLVPTKKSAKIAQDTFREMIPQGDDHLEKLGKIDDKLDKIFEELRQNNKTVIKINDRQSLVVSSLTNAALGSVAIVTGMVIGHAVGITISAIADRFIPDEFWIS